MSTANYTFSIIAVENAEIPHSIVKLGDREIGTVHKEGRVWYPLAFPGGNPNLPICAPKPTKLLAALELVGKFTEG